MKKTLVVVALVAAVLVSLGIAGYAYAQSEVPPVPENPNYVGPMGGRGRFNGQALMDGNTYTQSELMQERLAHRMEMQSEYAGNGFGMMGAADGNSIMHDTMIAVFADALGMTPEELVARHDAGETLWDIATAQGLSVEEIQDLMTSARSTALEQAVADGTITQEQADWMLDHMGQGGANGTGTGTCDGSGINQAGIQGRGMGRNARP